MCVLLIKIDVSQIQVQRSSEKLDNIICENKYHSLFIAKKIYFYMYIYMLKKCIMGKPYFTRNILCEL
jgi:hypothetical protein